MKTSNKGLDLIKEFEGCRLTAYVCPAGVLTIGYGHTGTDVYPGQNVSQAEADRLLVNDLIRFENTVNSAVSVNLTQTQFDALVSFTFNVGGGAFRYSTLLALLNQGDYAGAAGQFKRWVNGANGPLAGLVRRRAAEEALFLSEEQPPEEVVVEENSEIIATITANHDTLLKKRPVQSFELSANEIVNVENDKVYHLVWKGTEENGHIKVSLAYGGGNWYIYAPHWDGLVAGVKPDGKVLEVPYFSQRDNYRDASRTCFSSSCAMLLEFKKPGTLPGSRGDDKYVERVFQYGDTTVASTQIQALGSFGLSATFKTNGSLAWLREQLDKGNPVPIGILHHGPSNAPTGGGHWICVIGYNDSGFIVNDPWGKLDHRSGTYVSTNGDRVQYSTDLIRARWTVSNDNDGWAIAV